MNVLNTPHAPGTGIDRLEHIVQKRTSELQDALDQEKARNILKSKSIALASHEFRTPLTALLSSVDLVESYLRLGQLDAIPRHLLRIRKSVGFLTSILEEFLSLEKLEQGTTTAENTTLDLQGCVTDVTDDLRASLHTGQTIRLDYKGEAMIYGDKKIIRSILVNLVGNAIKYSRGDIRVRTEVTPLKIRLVVADTGIGIPKEEQHRLFSNFFRASNVGTEKGTGLGLAIVQRYLLLIGGDIRFRSNPKGTVFVIVMPQLALHHQHG